MYERGRKGLNTNEKFYRIIAFSQDSHTKLLQILSIFKALSRIGLIRDRVRMHLTSHSMSSAWSEHVKLFETIISKVCVKCPSF